MTGVIAHDYILTAGPQRWTAHLTALEVELSAAPGIGRLSAQLPPEARIEASPGDACTLELDGATVFTGIVRSLRSSPTGLALGAVDAAGRLAALRLALSFERKTAGGVIRDLASEAGIATGSIADGVDLAFYIADPGRSIWAHMARLAALSDMMLVVEADGRLATVGGAAAGADAALLYGREITAIADAEHGGFDRTVVVVPEAGAGSMSEPEALRIALDPFAGSRPAGPDAATLFRFEPALRTGAGAATAGGQRTRREAASARPLELETWLQPGLRPGQSVDLQGLPDGMAPGPVRAGRVRHRLTGEGTATRLTGTREPAGFDPAARLGNLAAAIGGLI